MGLARNLGFFGSGHEALVHEVLKVFRRLPDIGYAQPFLREGRYVELASLGGIAFPVHGAPHGFVLLFGDAIPFQQHEHCHERGSFPVVEEQRVTPQCGCIEVFEPPGRLARDAARSVACRIAE